MNIILNIHSILLGIITFFFFFDKLKFASKQKIAFLFFHVKKDQQIFCYYIFYFLKKKNVLIDNY